MAATQEALYGRIDLALSWSEADLPERERTKHVHRLHPYLGKFVPQLVEALLERYVMPGGHVLDPFAGSGTTLVQSLESGRDATGADVAGFNCLLMRVKTRRHNLDAVRRDLLWAHGRTEAFEADGRVRSDLLCQEQVLVLEGILASVAEKGHEAERSPTSLHGCEQC